VVATLRMLSDAAWKASVVPERSSALFGDLYAIPSKNGLMAPSRVRGSGVALINMREVFAYDRIGDAPMELAPLPERSSADWLVESGDLLFARQSLTFAGAGKCVLVESADRPRTFESHIIRVRLDEEVAYSPFFFYYFKSSFGRTNIEGIVEQVAAAGIRASDLAKLLVPLPPLAEQREITATLVVLDDKIESNRRAQEVGQRLLRALVDSALHDDSRGRARLDEYCDLVKDSVSVDEFRPYDNYIALEHMPRGSIFLGDWSVVEGIGSNKSRFQSGDVLFGKLRPYFKKVGVAPVGGVCSTDILVLRPKFDFDRALVAVVASSEALINSLSAAATGTRMPRASWSDLAAWPLPSLSTAEREHLGEKTSPLLERLTLLTYESKKLTALRDALLPQLLSGRWTVSSATAEAVGVAV